MTGSESEVDGLPAAPGGGRRRLAGATLGMAIGTTLSRITGVGRVIALTLAVGGGPFADAYNLANTTPNIIYDVVLGGVLSATFVPVFVDRLSTRRTKEAWDAISAVVTVTITVLVATTVAFLVLTPCIIDLYTVSNHHADVHQQQQVAVLPPPLVRPPAGLLRPHRGVQRPAERPGQVRRTDVRAHRQQPGGDRGPPVVPRASSPTPAWPRSTPTTGAWCSSGSGPPSAWWCRPALLVPSLLRSDLHLRFLWQPANAAMRTITRLAGWTFGWVLANQVALVVVLALADGARTPGRCPPTPTPTPSSCSPTESWPSRS